MVKIKFMVVNDCPLRDFCFLETFKEINPDGILVEITYSSPDGNGLGRINHQSFNNSKELVKFNKPLILCSSKKKSFFNLDPKFHWFLGHSNCGFLNLSEGGINNNFYLKYRNLRKIIRSRRDNDELSLLLWDIVLDVRTEKIILRENFAEALELGEKGIKQWLKRAKRIGYTGTKYEIIRAVEKNEEISYQPFAGCYFQGLFIGLEELFTGKDINQEILKLINKQGFPENKITLWTENNLQEAADLCRIYNLPWKILPKEIFKGAIVENVIDSQAKKISKNYGIDIKNPILF